MLGRPTTNEPLFSWNESTVFMTGATGFIGREVLLRLIQREVPRIFLLIRGENDAVRQGKLDRALHALIAEPDVLEDARKRITIIDGNISQERLGISPSNYDMLTNEVNHIIHCAANVSFADTLQEHLKQNLYGTRYALNLAEDILEKHDFRKFDYVGTAYIAGERDGLIREDELNAGQGFNNSYEHSKFQAEMEVFKRQLTLPITRHRPSVVMGDANSGRTSNFKMMYWVVKIYADGWWRAIPANPEASLDIVPVNFVADAIMHISPQESSLGQAYHIAAGPGKSAYIRDLCVLTENYFDKGRVVLIPHQWYSSLIGPMSRTLGPKRLRKILTAARVYEPYFKSTKIFDTGNLERALRGSELACPTVEGYFNTLFDFCVRTNWGKDVDAANTFASEKAAEMKKTKG